MELSSTVAIVTGASRGIGHAVSRALARKGAAVVCAARTLEAPSNKGSLRETVATIEREGGRALAVACDVTKPDDVARLVAQTLDHFGRLDILINNAGFYPESPIATMEPTLWDATLATNLTGPFLACRYALPSMIKRRQGSILNISSGSATNYDRKHVAYSAAKAGLERLTINLAEEVRPHGIAVNALNPGLVATEMSRWNGDPPEAVVPAALWIVSQPARTFTGRVVSRREFGIRYP